jgi:predicted nuclease of predicted toxin-antitoxin system
VAGRFPILTDENVQGPLVTALKAHRWDVLLTIDVLGQRSVDDTLFEYAAQHGRVLLSTDIDCLIIADRWIEQGRPFRLVFWDQGRHQRVRVGPFLQALEALAAKDNAFTASIEYLAVEG